MEELINYILEFGHLNQKQIELIEKNSEEITLSKGEYFSEAGKISKRLGFMLDGVIRNCYYNNKGDEITRSFAMEGCFTVDLNSFVNQIPSTEYIQAITDCKLIVISKKNWDELSSTIVDWERISSKIIAKTMTHIVNRISPLVSGDTATSYKMFLEQYSNLINRVPLAYVASYLGVTQSSLSRIRKNIR